MSETLARRQKGVSQRGHAGRPTRERGRPARMLSLRLPLSFPAMLGPPCRREPQGPGRSRGRAPLRLIPVEEMGEAAAGGTPALPGGLP